MNIHARYIECHTVTSLITIAITMLAFISLLLLLFAAFRRAPAKAAKTQSVGGVVGDVVQVLHRCRTHNSLAAIRQLADILACFRSFPLSL